MTKRRKTAQVFNPTVSVAPLGIIAMDGAKELGTKINDYLVTWARQSGQDIDTFLILAVGTGYRYLPYPLPLSEVPIGRRKGAYREHGQRTRPFHHL